VFTLVDLIDILCRDSYVLLQGLSGTGSGFLQAVPLVMYYLKITLLGSTPRSVYAIKYSPRMSAWGTLFPAMTQLVVITFGYSIISPIINGLAFASFFLFYLLYKYLFTWVNDQPRSSETGGLFFPKAIQHLFVGLYVQQLCLCALFFLAQNSHDSPSAIPEGALMIVLIVFTVGITLMSVCYHNVLTFGLGILSKHHSELLWPPH
jgi:calcium permeable stress-gated cation channel